MRVINDPEEAHLWSLRPEKSALARQLLSGMWRVRITEKEDA